MTPERMAALVRRWVRFYTRNLPPPIAARRATEIEADLHDHTAHERAAGTPDRRIALGIAGRMVRGLPADASWRRSVARSSTRRQAMKTRKTLSRPVVRVALVTAAILLVPLIAQPFSEGPGWSAGDFLLATLLLGGTGLLLELAARNPRNLAYRAVAVAIGLAAIVLGEMDDAPGLMLFGGVVVLGTVAMAVRAAQRSG